MPGNRKWRVLNRKIQASRKIKKQKRKSGRRTNTSFKSVVAHGVRTLASFVPGQTIVRPAVDFLLKTFGFVKFYLTSDNLVESTLTLSGASTSRPLLSSDFFSSIDMYGVPEVATVPMYDKTGAATGTTKALCTRVNHKAVRLLMTTWTLTPTGQLGQRSGMWAMAWQPNYTGSVADTAFGMSALNMRPPTFDNVKEMAYSVWGPASRGLTLVWRPKVQRDGFAAMPNDTDDTSRINSARCLGWLFVAYEDTNRPSGEAFSYSELSAEINMRTKGLFSVKDMSSLEKVGTRLIKPLMFKAEELTTLCSDGVDYFHLNTFKDENGILKVQVPPTDPKYDALVARLSTAKLDAMTL